MFLNLNELSSPADITFNGYGNHNNEDLVAVYLRRGIIVRKKRSNPNCYPALFTRDEIGQVSGSLQKGRRCGGRLRDDENRLRKVI